MWQKIPFYSDFYFRVIESCETLIVWGLYENYVTQYFIKFCFIFQDIFAFQKQKLFVSKLMIVPIEGKFLLIFAHRKIR